MTDQRSGSDRRLASQKQEVVTGGNTNYYLHDLPATEFHAAVVVETEDIIERLEMLFSTGTSFKSMCRLCKLRMNLGKPGSTETYEIDKVVYYTSRDSAISLRREQRVGWFGKILRRFRDPFGVSQFANIRELEIDIPDPKRLEPYSFIVGEFIDALNPTPTEKVVFEMIFKLAVMRLVRGPAYGDEANIAKIGALAAGTMKINNATNKMTHLV